MAGIRRMAGLVERVHCDTSLAAEWLIDGARSAAGADDVLAELCDRLNACGVPLWRVAVFVRTLHPQIMGRSFLWRREHGVKVGEAPYELLDTDEYRDSPVTHVSTTGRSLRRQLADPNCPTDFTVLRDLREEGATDYLVSPLVFTDGTVHIATWTTQQPGGFTAEQLAGIEAIIRPLARVAEVRALQRTAANLLDTYVGTHAGERILGGQIRRGDTEAIDAAIWFSDMRSSTMLAELMPPREFIDLLNRYFDCQIPTILDHGGEILKFMGDGLLAIFPIGDAEVSEVCGRALGAARIARAEIEKLGAPEPVANSDRPRFGLALHLGRVLYGNIGSANRLDFTCIGPAVNLAARIEKLAGEIGHAILASREFAAGCGIGLARIGSFRLPGFAAKQSVYGLAEISSPAAP
jgi:adenylate cyclase